VLEWRVEARTATGRIRTDDLRFTKPLHVSVSDGLTSTYDSDAASVSKGVSNPSGIGPSADVPSGGFGVPDSPPEAITDADLAAVVAAWPMLPEAVRARIVGMVEAVATMNAGTSA